MKIKRILQNLLLLFLSLMFAFALIEIGVRLAKTELHPPNLFISQTEGVPYKLRPNFHSYTTTGIPLDINSIGLRDAEYQLQPPPNTFRIVVLGDSVTMGQAVRQEDSYPEQLEAMFAAEKGRGGKNVEVVNAGVSGYGAYEEMLFLKETAIKYKPDMIIVSFALNDISSVPLVFRGSDIKSRAFFKVKEFVKYNFWSYSYLLRTIGSFKYNIANIGSGKPWNTTANTNAINEEDYTPKSAAWNLTYEAIKGIKETADANNAKVVIVMLPELRFSSNKIPQAYGYSYTGLHKSIAEQFKQVGADVNVLDVLPAFSNYTKQEVTVSETDAHPNKKGHEVIAKAIKEFLDQKSAVEN